MEGDYLGKAFLGAGSRRLGRTCQLVPLHQRGEFGAGEVLLVRLPQEDAARRCQHRHRGGDPGADPASSMPHGLGALTYVPHAEPDHPADDLGDRAFKSVTLV
jgi:hypothetical protein